MGKRGIVADWGRQNKMQLPKGNQSIPQSTARYAAHQGCAGVEILY